MCTGIVLLVLLAVGYWVLTLSQNQQKPLNILGRIIGGIILLSALGGLVCGAFCKMRGSSCGSSMCPSSYSAKGGCGVKSTAGCPMMDKAAAASAEKAPEVKK